MLNDTMWLGGRQMKRETVRGRSTNTESAAPPCSLRAHRDHNDAYFRKSLIGESPARARSVGREGARMCLPCMEGFFVLRCSAETATLWDDGSFGQCSARET